MQPKDGFGDVAYTEYDNPATARRLASRSEVCRRQGVGRPHTFAFCAAVLSRFERKLGNAMQPMTTPPGDYFGELLHHYSRRDTNAIYETVMELATRPDFPAIVEQLTGHRKSPTHARDLVDITRAMIQRIEAQIIAKRKQSTVFESYYGIAETLKVKLNTKVSEIYLETTFPNDLLEEARRQLQNDTVETGARVLPVHAVDRYKNELSRIEKGRRALVYTLEKYSNFPIKSAVALMRTLSLLHQRLRSNYYGYLALKPAFLEIVSIGGGSDIDFHAAARSLTEGTYPVLHRYYTTGVEPSLLQQLELRFAIARLMATIKERKALSDEELCEFDDRLSRIWNHKGESGLGVYGHGILLETLRQVSLDREGLSKALAKTLIEEYCTAERQMTVIHMHIVRQLAFTSEFLEHFDLGESDSEDSAEKEKARIAQDKLIGLAGVFDLTAAVDRARSCSLMELERVALGIPTNVASSQIVEWLEIYGVIFANSHFSEVRTENRRFLHHETTDLPPVHLSFDTERGLPAPRRRESLDPSRRRKGGALPDVQRRYAAEAPGSDGRHPHLGEEPRRNDRGTGIHRRQAGAVSHRGNVQGIPIARGRLRENGARLFR
jgi:hypothetical protein